MRQFLRHRGKGESGFTVTEILVALVIFGLLAAIAVPIYVNQQRVAKEGSLKAVLSTMHVVLKQEKTSNNGLYPQELPADAPIPEGASVYYTTSPDMDMYCIEIESGGITMFLSGLTDGSSVINQEECTYEGSSVMRPTLSGSVTASNEPVLVWTPIEGATGYEVSVESPEGNALYVVTDTTWTGSVMSSQQSFTVRTIAGEERSAPSNRVRLTPSRSKPTLAPVVQVINITNDDKRRYGTLKWDPVPWATGYRVYNQNNGAVLSSGTSTSYSTSASTGQVRQYYVEAYNEVGSSPRSEVVTLKGPLPGQPNLTVDFETTAEGIVATLKWDKVEGADSYKILKNGELLEADASSPYVDTTPFNSGMVEYWVVPVTKSGEDGEASQVWAYQTAYGLPAAPTLTGSGWGNYFLDWQPVPHAEEYVVEQRVAPSEAWTVVKTVSGTTTTVAGPSNDNPGYYYFRVAAINHLGKGAYSNVLIFTGAPKAPTITASSVTNSRTFSATAVCNNSNVDLYYRHQNDSGTPGTYKAFTAWTKVASGTAVTSTAPLSYGQAIKFNIQFHCRVRGVTPEVNSAVVNRVLTGTAIAPSMPSATATATFTGLNGTNARYTSSGTVTTGCPTGTQLEYRLDSAAWANMSGTGTGNKTKDAEWGTKVSFSHQFRCKAGSTYSSVRTVNASTTSVIPPPTSISAVSTYQTRRPSGGVITLRSTKGRFAVCQHGTQLQTRWKRNTDEMSGWSVEYPRELSNSYFPDKFRPTAPSGEFRCRATGSGRSAMVQVNSRFRYHHNTSWTDAS